MRLLHPTRRSFLAGASALSMAGVVRPALAQSPSLVVAPRQIEVLGRAATVYGITGPDGKPGLRAREGDRFTGQVQNDTDAGLVMHWHGQIFAPEGADRAYPGGGETPAGAADTVDFALTPGTHWMHSHQMTEQLLLAAPMITVEADAGNLQEVVLMLHDFTFQTPEEVMAGLGGSMMHGGGAMAGMDHSQMGHGSGAGSGGGTMMAGMVHANDVAYDAFLANDRTLSDPEVVTVDPASTLRLRIINGATASAFWIDAGALPSQVIAVDGSPCQPYSAAAYPIAQGQRLDLLLTVPAGGGAYPVFAQLEASTRRTGIILATAGAAVTRQAHDAETASAYLDTRLDAALRAAKPLPDRAPTRSEHLMLGEGANYRWTINGAVHGEHTPLQGKIGDRIELMFMNPTMMMHPMHLHGHHFQIVDVGMGRFAGPMRDVVIVPPQGMVTVAVDLDKAGSWYLHCHHLYHMATGMMTELVVS
jgi:FtsP/CotA-like multicopper oxidase with cupredoxin domain